MILLTLIFIGLSSYEAQADTEECIPVEIQYAVKGDISINFCKLDDSNVLVGTGILPSTDTASIKIPKKIVDAVHGNCEPDVLLVLINNVEVKLDVSHNPTYRTLNVDLPAGDVKLEVIGSSQPVYPLPTQYCGSSLGYDSQFAPPLKQIKMGVPFVNIQCNEGKTPIFKHDSMNVACVTQKAISKLVERGWTRFIPTQTEIKMSTVFPLDFNHSKYHIWYSIYGAVLDSIQKEKETSYLNIKLSPVHDGHLFIIVPKDLIGNKELGWNGDFVVIIDGLEVDFRDERPHMSHNTLVIPITESSKLVQIIPAYPLSG